MEIAVYGKPGCGICDAAKNKLRLLGLPFASRDLAEALEYHEDWRADGTANLMAKYAMNNYGIPLIVIDGEVFTYPEAMCRLRNGSQSSD